MAIDPDPRVVGWYRYGARPGDPTGATVLAAHIDAAAYGVGPLAKLVDLKRNELMIVRSGSVVYRYRVQSVTEIRKSVLNVGSLFTRSGPPLLHVVTCGGRWNPAVGHYDSNIVAVAVLVN